MVAFAPFNDDSCLEKSDHKRWNVFPVQHKRLGFVVIFYCCVLFRFIVFLTFVVTFLLGNLILRIFRSKFHFPFNLGANQGAFECASS